MPSLKRLPKPSCGHRILRIILFVYDLGFWLIGAVILGVGIYAEIEKKDYQAVVDVLVTPTIFMIVVGSFMFILGFIGCIGALRENITLLRIFGITLAVVFALQLIGAILALAFKSQTEELVKSGLQHSIRNYYNDPDIQFAVDAMQENFECCGGADYDDWENNIYFKCNTGATSSCGVPYTCCVSTKVDMIANTMCGNGVREGVTNRLQLQGRIWIRGCVDAFTAWLEDNLALIAGIILGFALPQGSILNPAKSMWDALRKLYARYSDRIFGLIVNMLMVTQIQEELLLYNYQQVMALTSEDITETNLT